jgi:hypothetical protein
MLLLVEQWRRFLWCEEKLLIFWWKSVLGFSGETLEVGQSYVGFESG